MTSRNGVAALGSDALLREVLPAVITLLLLFWIVVVVALGSLLALQVFDLPLAGEAPRNFATLDMVWAAAAVYLVCLAAAILTRAIHAPATIPVVLAVGGVIGFAGATGTRSSSALLVVLAGFGLAWLVGGAILRRLPATEADVPLVRAPIAIAIGLGVLGLGFFLLSALSLLGAASATIFPGVLLFITLALDRAHLMAGASRLRQWRPMTPTWFETVLFGAIAGLLAFSILAAFVPETQTDATREHLPIAREIWQTGTVAEFPPMGVSRDPVQGHLLYAVAYGFGGTTAATLVQTFAGLTAIAGVAALGWFGAGRVAAFASAALFAPMPIVLWQLGHAFLDLFPVLFLVTAASCVLIWQRDGALVWLAIAGALAGFGFACKVTLGWGLVGLAAGIFLVGRAPWRWRERLLPLAMFGLAALAIVLPWLVRGYVVTGSLPGAGYLAPLFDGIFFGLNPVTNLLAPDSLAPILDTSSSETTAAYLAQRGLGHAPLDLLRAPWALTFHGEQFRFPLIGRGEIGISLLMLLPLALFAPRTRAIALLAITAIVSYLIWFLTPYQIARHLLPTLAIASALAGIGVGSAVTAASSPLTRALSIAAQAGVILGCLTAPLLLLPSSRAVLPVNLVLGRESTGAFAERSIPSATALIAASELLPPDTPVLYIGGDWEGPQIYTEARLTYAISDRLGATPEKVLATLDRLNVHHFIWNRADANRADWQSTLLSSSFLEHHTRILAGDRDAYLFEVLPQNELRWGTDTPGNLLGDPEFATVRKGNGPWTTSEKAGVDDGILTLRRRSAISQDVPIAAGKPYLLIVSGKCGDADDRVELVMEWFDADGRAIGSASERVIPGTEWGEQFLWRRAPGNTASASVTVAVTGSADCDVDAITLHEAP